MRPHAPALLGAAFLVIAAMPLTGCGATTPSAAPAVSATTGTLSSTSSTGNGARTAPMAPIGVDGQRGRPAAAATTPSLPPDWPPDLPLPPGTLTGGPLGATSWMSYSTNSFAATAGSIIEFRAEGTSDSLGGYVDNIRISDGVPEPASWAMMLIGFGGLGALLRRRRTAFAAA